MQEILSDLTVVEIGTSVAGPFAAQIFADLGAEVIKVENPKAGDDARQWGPPFVDGVAAVFYTLNRNKKSVAVDLKDQHDLNALRSFIVERADVVIQNLRPGLVARFGIDQSLTERNPRLVYCDIGSYGEVGPMRDKPGYDPLLQAFSGLMSVNGMEGAPPMRVGTSIIDLGAAMWAVIGILSALHRRARTGQGGVVTTSLLETSIGWVTTHIASYLATGNVPTRHGSEHPSLAPYKAFLARDGHFVVGVGNNDLFRRLCECIGRPELADDHRFRTNPGRVKHRKELNALLDNIFNQRERSEWIEALEAIGVPCAPYQNIEEALRHEQVKAIEILQEVPGATQEVVGIPIRFAHARPRIVSRAPELGAHTDEILGAFKARKTSTKL